MVPGRYSNLAVSTESPDLRLAALVGRKISRLRRILYVLDGVVDESVGAIEFGFVDGATVVLDSAPDGEALVVKSARWVDPFGDDLSPENEEFVVRSGKWTAFDMSDHSRYLHLIGASIDGATPVLNSAGKIVGAVLSTTSGSIRTDVEGDELVVDVS